MSKQHHSRLVSGLNNLLKTNRSETLSFRQVFEWVGKTVPFEIGLVVSTMPRGGLQIVQPQRIPETMARLYGKQFHAEDKPSWTAILEGRTVRGDDCWKKNNGHVPYITDFMHVIGLRYVAAAPLRQPVINGYAGALVLFRGDEQGEFTTSDLQAMEEIAEELDSNIDRFRDGRQGAACAANITLSHRSPMRQFVFDKSLNQLMPGSDLDELDEGVRMEMIHAVKQEFSRLTSLRVNDRLTLTDSRGDNWIFHLRSVKEYPALGGPTVFCNMQPAACEWAAMRPADFQADPELARLIPALKFMEDEFRRGPTLTEIAHTAHLSPFHFHRRFTELLGLTPKHFMLECQIEESKRMLSEGKLPLSDIAAICGFAHQSHFTSRFKQATGLTPTRWRRLAAERRIAAKIEQPVMS
ncbi:MAG TPA: AraC family transcriptional regulator [Tepidisphaeraceae bacterium]|nr:AraC family transcriptional regulator [Tepidisphaeraceae bacterium]